ncbi:hypothetical protein VV02_13210 [Luteipulveratus mongoliensis]|uniref:Resolvase/invertase-type recombinase catalytic domain-containing protein n=1 Tax=Luteipulveratus mongoliensis TaxID=571913 RepID=A0A0K1JIR6_9MICO|nr:hypothetical protein VV02_13210 [Luteipulveratus mongoliensis]
MCTKNGWGVVALESDDGVASNAHKPGLDRMLDLARAGEIDLVTMELGRLTRDLADLGHIVDFANNTGVTIVFAVNGLDLSSEQGRADTIRLPGMATALEDT